MTKECSLLKSYVWPPDSIVELAERFFVENRGSVMRVTIGKWKSLFRATQKAETYDAFHRLLAQHLHHKKPHNGAQNRERWKDPNLTELLMKAVGEAASFPEAQDQEAVLYIRRSKLSEAERKELEDHWRLARANTFLGALGRFLQKDAGEADRSGE